MDAREIERRITAAKEMIQREVYDRLPRKVGIVAVNHFKNNFRRGGWLDDGFTPWPRTKRQDGEGTDAEFSPLTSRRNHLMNSLQARTEPGAVIID